MEILTQIPLQNASLLPSRGECGRPLPACLLRGSWPPKATLSRGTHILGEAGCGTHTLWPSTRQRGGRSSRRGSAPADKRFAAETQVPLSNRGVPCSRRQGFPLQLRGSAPPDLASAGRVASLRGRLENPLLDFRNSIYQTAESCSPRLPVDLVGCRRDPPSF